MPASGLNVVLYVARNILIIIRFLVSTHSQSDLTNNDDLLFACNIDKVSEADI